MSIVFQLSVRHQQLYTWPCRLCGEKDTNEKIWGLPGASPVVKWRRGTYDYSIRCFGHWYCLFKNILNNFDPLKWHYIHLVLFFILLMITIRYHIVWVPWSSRLSKVHFCKNSVWVPMGWHKFILLFWWGFVIFVSVCEVIR